MACVVVTLVVFIYGFGGFLANWAGLITDETNPNLYFFQLFSTNAYMNTWTGMGLDWLDATFSRAII